MAYSTELEVSLRGNVAVNVEYAKQEVVELARFALGAAQSTHQCIERHATSGAVRQIFMHRHPCIELEIELRGQDSQ